MLLIDGHLDLALNAIQFGRDITCSALTLRQETPPNRLVAFPTVALPELRQGRVAVCFATLLARSTGTPAPPFDYPSAAQAFAVARGHLAYYRALEALGHARIITDGAALQAHWSEWIRWETDTQKTPPPLGFVLSMESADPILEPDQLAEWHAAGVRLIGPAHYGPGRYAGGTGTEHGLSDRGRALLGEMQRLGVVLDATHLSDQAFWQALELHDGPIIASHNNCRALVPKQRQFDDNQLRALIARDAVIGAACDAIMLEPSWIIGQSSNAGVGLARVVDHIDHICQLAGSSRHVAIGSDLDGGFGRFQSPADLDTIADLQRLPALLRARGYAERDIAAVMHGNWLRLLGETLGPKA